MTARIASLLVGVAIATFCTASEPRIISGARGQYRVVEIPDIERPFELTDDLKFAVVQHGFGFHVLSAIDGKRVGELPRRANHDWKVVGNRLVAANESGWETFSLPELQPIGTKAGPPKLPGMDRGTPPMALARGWYCNGLFYDDAAEKIVASCRYPSPRGWIARINNLELYAVNQRTTVLPFEIQQESRHVVLRDYDRIAVSPPGTPNRFGMRWMTMVGQDSFTFRPVSKTSGLYIELIDHDFSQVVGNTHTLVGWNTPSLLLDPKANFADWKKLVLPTDTLVDARLNIHPSSQSNEAQDIGSSSLFSELQNAEYTAVDEVIDRYMVEAVPEFELAVGQKPKNIPVAFTVRFENDDSLTQVVWADMTRAEVLSRFAKAAWRREASRLLEEQNQAIAAHQQKSYETDAANERMRNTTIARKTAWKTNSIYTSLFVFLFGGSFGCLYFINFKRKTSPAFLEPSAPVSSSPTAPDFPHPSAPVSHQPIAFIDDGEVRPW